MKESVADNLNSNTADLRLLEEMGVTPDQKTREKRPTLKAVGTMVLATVRMGTMRREWREKVRLHEMLVKARQEQQVKSGRKVSRRGGVE
jgi:hypothetical protein